MFVPVLVMNTQLDGMAVFVVMAAAALLLIGGPINSAIQTRTMMRRLPRRVREAPLLVLIPRAVMVPVLVGVATIPVNFAIGFGACAGSMVLGGIGGG